MRWGSVGQDGSGSGIYGQRYTSAGTASGPEFQVNSYTDSGQINPSVTALADGGWVVTWESWDQDGSRTGVYGQRYTAAGVASGSEFRVNTYTTSWQEGASVTALADGGWVVMWASEGQDGAHTGIYGQRFDATGAAVQNVLSLDVTTEPSAPAPLEDFRSPLGDGQPLTLEQGDEDGFYADRVFRLPDRDDGSTVGLRHLGIDWNGDGGGNTDDDAVVYAVYGGTVSFISPEAGSSGSVSGWGGVVMINHTLPDGRTYTTVYGHLENLNPDIAVGAWVDIGTLLGDLDDIDEEPSTADPTAGGPGFSQIIPFFAHLHFEVREGHQDGTQLGPGYADAVAEGVTGEGIRYADVVVGGSTVRFLDPFAFIEAQRGVAVEASVQAEAGEFRGTLYYDTWTLNADSNEATPTTVNVIASGIDVIVRYIEGATQFMLNLFEAIRYVGNQAVDTLIIGSLDGTTIQQNTIYFDGKEATYD